MSEPVEKVVVALKKGLDPGVAINAASHMSLGLSHLSGENAGDLGFDPYADSTGLAWGPVSTLPLIVLSAKPSHLVALHTQARAAGLPVVAFTESMTGGTGAEQVERTLALGADQVVVYGVATMGARHEVDPLTSRMSLWK